jgi:hypothetical protein
MRCSTFSKLTIGTGLAALPSIALASDPTPLFVLFVAIPIGIISILLVMVSYSLPNVGRICAIAFLVALIPVTAWASDVGYLENAGIGLYFSWLMGGIAFFLARSRIIKAGMKNNGVGDTSTNGT